MGESGSDDSKQELESLRRLVSELEGDVASLRRRLHDAPKRVRMLEERLADTKGRLTQAVSQNERLTTMLRDAREHIGSLREEVEKLTQPPSGYGTVLGCNDDGTVDVRAGGRKMRVAVSSRPRRGSEAPARRSPSTSRSAWCWPAGRTAPERWPRSRNCCPAVTGQWCWGRADEERVVELSAVVSAGPIRSGDNVLIDSSGDLVIERLPRPEVEDLILEEVPDISYDDVGGLDSQIEQITDAVELPFVHHALFAEYDLPAPKGVLLYGPAGAAARR